LLLPPSCHAHFADSFARLHFIPPGALTLRLKKPTLTLFVIPVSRSPESDEGAAEESTRNGSSYIADPRDSLFEPAGSRLNLLHPTIAISARRDHSHLRRLSKNHPLSQDVMEV